MEFKVVDCSMVCSFFCDYDTTFVKTFARVIASFGESCKRVMEFLIRYNKWILE
jgi:hypothetical protein